MKDSMLTDVVETYNIRRENDGKVYSGKEETAELDENCYVSMNMWACPDGFIDKLNGMFTDFMKENKDSLTAEFLLCGYRYNDKNRCCRLQASGNSR